MHTPPTDLKKTLSSVPKALSNWKTLTPLARNEFICWITSAKKPETRQHRIERTINEVSQGKRRPCCWAGCPHRSKNKK